MSVLVLCSGSVGSLTVPNFLTNLLSIRNNLPIVIVTMREGNRRQIKEMGDRSSKIWAFLDDESYEHDEKFLMLFDPEKIVNGRCIRGLDRPSIHKKWEEAGIRVPKHVMVIPGEAFEVPFDPPWICRYPTGHGNRSTPQIVYSKEEVVGRFRSGKKSPCLMIQEFVDTNIDGKYYNGRVIKIGDKILEVVTRWGNHWNTCVYDSRHRFGYKQCLNALDYYPGLRDIPDFDEQIYNIARNTTVDIGMIDFSIKDGIVIPWEITLQFAITSIIRVFTNEDLDGQCRVIEEIFRYMGENITVTREEVWSSILKLGVIL